MVGPVTMIWLKNDIQELSRLCQELEVFAERCGLPPKVVFDLSLALDELVTNIISYGFPENGEHDILVELSMENDVVRLRIEDDGTPFNPLNMAEPDTSAPLEERQIGGLGIHFVKHLMSSVEYERSGTKNILRITKDCSGSCACLGKG
ncbi:MAG: ATP-binding protein [Desulfovibrio sp.]|uniref:ATP-binding protein n=1 Tax=Desulfovibrio sp. 7SRBS1 TaxID=3378064 RepID=UPI003B400102